MYRSNNKKGLVLVTVMWIVVVLTVIVAMLGRKSRLDSKITLSRLESTRCKWACRAGIEKALALLYQDIYYESTIGVETDSYLDIWSHETEYADELIDFPLIGCSFSVYVTDETGKINVNLASRDLLLALPNMTEEIADAIIDWRDTDENVSEYGVEGGYYENLPFAYMNRNSPFRTIRELLLVRSVTDELLYGEDTNLNGVLDYNERDGSLSPPGDNEDDILDQGWAAYLTCYPVSAADIQINVNTAPEAVLATLMGGTEEAYYFAQQIVAYREELFYGIEDVSQLSEEGIVSSDYLSLMQDYLTVDSDLFNIRCVATATRGSSGGVTLQTEAIVDRSVSPCNILYWYQGASN